MQARVGPSHRAQGTHTQGVGVTPFVQKSLPRQGLGDSRSGAAVLTPRRSRGRLQKVSHAAADKCTLARFWARRMGTSQAFPG